MFGSVRMDPLELTALAHSIVVETLPSAPETIAGWGSTQAPVGDTGIKVEAEAGTLETGKTLSLRVVVTSVGNIRTLTKVPLESTSAYQVYEDRPELKTYDSGDLLVLERTFRLSIVPLTPGRMVLPELQLPYFDPEAKVFKIARASLPSVEVTGIAKAAPAPTVAELVSPVEPTQIPTVPEPPVSLRDPMTTTAWIFWAIVGGVAVVGCIGLMHLLYRMRRKKMIVAQIRRAKDYEELRRQVQEHVGRMLLLPAAEVTAHQVRARIGAAQKTPAAYVQLAELLSELEAAPLPQVGLEELKERAIHLLS